MGFHNPFVKDGQIRFPDNGSLVRHVEKWAKVRGDKLAYRFQGHQNLHVRGYKEKGNINTPLELAMLNETSRFNLVIDVIDRVPKLRTRAAHLKEEMRNAIIDNLRYAHEHGADRPELANWTWPY